MSVLVGSGREIALLSNVNDKTPLSRWFVPLAYGLLAIIAAVFSRGFLEPDEITHYLYARSAWSDRWVLLSIWGRMGCTAFYGLVAQWGVVPARLLAVGVTVLTGVGAAHLLRYFLTYPTVGKTGPSDSPSLAHAAGSASMDPQIALPGSWVVRHRTALGWMLLFAQPWFALNSFTVMTEMLLACTWVWAAVVLVRCRRRPGGEGGGVLLASVLVGLGGLVRPEGWLAIACWPIFTWLWSRNLKFRSAGDSRLLFNVLLFTLVAAAPTLLWYGLGVADFHDWTWFVAQWPWSAKSIYGHRAGIFLAGTIASMAVWMWAPIFLGAMNLLRREESEENATFETAQIAVRQRDGRLLLLAPFAGMFLVHGLLGSLGLFGSMSLPRYFIPIAPMAAVLGVLGLARVEVVAIGKRWNQRRFRAALILAPLVAIFVLLGGGAIPTWPSQAMCAMDVVATVIQHRMQPEEYPKRLILGHPYLVLKLKLPIGTPAETRLSNSDAIASAPSGTWLVMEEKLWAREGRPTFAQLEKWGWKVDEAMTAEAEAVRPPVLFPLANLECGKVQLWVKG